MSSDVDLIKDRLSIVDVVSQYVDLKPAGSRLKGLSPFTREKTPSFFVSPEQGYYHCFSTDQGGDIFTFIQTIEGLDFIGALKLLADKAGVELANKKSSDSADKRQIYDALEAATDFYQSCFLKASAAQHFINRRGINDDEVMRFRIGYAPDDWRQLHNDLQGRFSDQILAEAGLIKQKNNSTYDTFRDRIMFPIRGIAGRVVAFSGRRLDNESSAKYLNSPEGPLFKKSKTLYGLYEGRTSIKQVDFAILVEGQIDLVLAHQAGTRNTVASSGTAFTDEHLKIIGRYTNNLLIAFDPDSAGIKASVKVAELAFKQGMTVKVIDLPADKDPADLINQAPANWHKLLKNSISLPQQLTYKAQGNSRNQTNLNQTLSKVVLPLVNQIQSPIEQDSELTKIAEIIEIDKSVLERELAVIKQKQSSRDLTTQQPKNRENSAAIIGAKIPPTDKILASLATKLELLKHHYPDEKIPDTTVIKTGLPKPTTKALLSNNVKPAQQLLSEINILIRDYIIRNRMDELKSQINKIEHKSNKSVEDLNQIISLKKKIEDLPIESK
jgi:DNA primase